MTKRLPTERESAEKPEPDKLCNKIKKSVSSVFVVHAKISTYPDGRRSRLLMVAKQFKRLSPVSRTVSRAKIYVSWCLDAVWSVWVLFLIFFSVFYVEIFSKIHHALKWKNVITSRWLMVLRESANEPGLGNHYSLWLHCRTAHVSATMCRGLNTKLHGRSSCF